MPVFLHQPLIVHEPSLAISTVIWSASVEADLTTLLLKSGFQVFDTQASGGTKPNTCGHSQMGTMGTFRICAYLKRTKSFDY